MRQRTQRRLPIVLLDDPFGGFPPIVPVVLDHHNFLKAVRGRGCHRSARQVRAAGSYLTDDGASTRCARMRAVGPAAEAGCDCRTITLAAEAGAVIGRPPHSESPRAVRRGSGESPISMDEKNFH